MKNPLDVLAIKAIEDYYNHKTKSIEKSIERRDTEINQDVHFEMELDIKKSLEESTEDKRIIYGYASTPDTDVENEIILSNNLDISYFVEHGYFNWDHEHSPYAILGFPYKEKCVVSDNGFYVEGELFKNRPYADEVWGLIKSINESKAPRSLSFSIEGKILEREDNVIKKAMITEVAVTPRPVNPNATLHALIKSFKQTNKAMEAGYEVDPSKMTGGGALRVESMDGALHAITYVINNRDSILKELCSKLELSLEEATLYMLLTDSKFNKLVKEYEISENPLF